MKKIRERYFFGFWTALLAVLWVIRLACPSVVRGKAKGIDVDIEEETKETVAETVIGTEPYHRIKGVASYARSFPDLQEVQIVAAQRYGVTPVKDRDEAELRKSELVYIGSSPYYDIDKRMNASIPYLVPRASRLLHDIGRNYLDSLASKGIPLHKVIVTSVLRTEADVARLVRRNGNASDRSCHRFGTTFDICYNRYATVSPPGEQRRAVRNDTLKWVLSEVLRDMRENDRCYVKYEVKQGCFHITAR